MLSRRSGYRGVWEEELGSRCAGDWIQSGRGRHAPGIRVEILEEGEILIGWTVWKKGSRSVEGNSRT